MEQSGNKKRQAGIILICGITVAVLWMWILPPTLCPLWKNFTFLPESFYFPVEEFLAMNGHHNSPIIQVVGFFMIVFTLIWALKLNGKLQKSYEYISIAVILFLTAATMLPCLCRPKEVGRRLRCISNLKEAYHQISLYADENNGRLPDTFTIKESKHSVIYHGEGHSLQGNPFIILEDAGHCHAGDMRHQLLSNGEIQSVYPWKSR